RRRRSGRLSPGTNVRRAAVQPVDEVEAPVRRVLHGGRRADEGRGITARLRVHVHGEEPRAHHQGDATARVSGVLALYLLTGRMPVLVTLSSLSPATSRPAGSVSAPHRATRGRSRAASGQPAMWWSSMVSFSVYSASVYLR